MKVNKDNLKCLCSRLLFYLTLWIWEGNGFHFQVKSNCGPQQPHKFEETPRNVLKWRLKLKLDSQQSYHLQSTMARLIALFFSISSTKLWCDTVRALSTCFVFVSCIQIQIHNITPPHSIKSHLSHSRISRVETESHVSLLYVPAVCSEADRKK